MAGLIYVLILAVWAVVLVPAWLRRHDHQDPSRSVDRFTRSMRQLATQTPVAGESPQRESAASRPGPAQPEVRVVSRPHSQQRARQGAQGPAPTTGQRAARDARGAAAARRRVVLAVLAVALVAVVALAVAGIAPVFVIAVPVAGIGGFVGLARHQVRTADAARAAARSASARAEGVAVPATRAATRTGVRADGTWEATSAPLPTYVTAPAASTVPRNIDTPGAWTAAAMLERAQQEKMRAERMEQAKREAIARARAEQAAAESRTRDEEYLAAEAANWSVRPLRRRAVNE